MRKVTLFIAVSLDGYIADKNGGVSWLAGQEPNADDMVSYHDFIQEIDTVIMGWTTYHQIVTELSPDHWYYQGMQSYVVNHKKIPPAEDIIFTQETPAKLVKSLRESEGEGIWICGGANLAQQLIREDLIDTYHLSVIPTILGDGIRLFGTADREIRLKWKGTRTYHGITDLIYERGICPGHGMSCV